MFVCVVALSQSNGREVMCLCVLFRYLSPIVEKLCVCVCCFVISVQ